MQEQNTNRMKNFKIYIYKKMLVVITFNILNLIFSDQTDIDLKRFQVYILYILICGLVFFSFYIKLRKKILIILNYHIGRSSFLRVFNWNFVIFFCLKMTED